MPFEYHETMQIVISKTVDARNALAAASLDDSTNSPTNLSRSIYLDKVFRRLEEILDHCTPALERQQRRVDELYENIEPEQTVEAIKLQSSVMDKALFAVHNTYNKSENDRVGDVNG